MRTQGGVTLPLPHWPTVSNFTKPDGPLGLYYGGTIADAAMVRAIQHLRARGYKVLFYPFLMMACRRRTPRHAPGAAGSPPRPRTWRASSSARMGYLRFVHHCMTLCEQTGGVEGFAVGSEMVALNRIRDVGGVYPAVPFWRQIAAEAKARLGSACLVTYAADWSEYRYHDRGGGTVDFPLDPLWADPNIDLVGIDAYFPITDEGVPPTTRRRSRPAGPAASSSTTTMPVLATAISAAAATTRRARQSTIRSTR